MPEAGAHPGCRPCGQPVLQRDQHPLLRLLQGGGVHGAELVGEVRERDQVKQWKYMHIKGAQWRKRNPSQSGRNRCPTGIGVYEDQYGSKVCELCDKVQIIVAWPAHLMPNTGLGKRWGVDEALYYKWAFSTPSLVIINKYRIFYKLHKKLL